MRRVVLFLLVPYLVLVLMFTWLQATTDIPSGWLRCVTSWNSCPRWKSTD